MKNENNITTLDEILDKKYGKRGAEKREQWEQEFQAFQLGVLHEEARLKFCMTNITPTPFSKYPTLPA